jgi:inner membrane protein
MLQNSLWKRIIVLLIIGVALMLPMSMIMGLIWERKNLQTGVLREIAASSTGAQSVQGPMLLVPYTRRIIEVSTVKDAKGNDVEKREPRLISETLAFLPESLDINGKLDTFVKKRGIYTARLYTTPLQFKGRFVLPKNYMAEAKEGTITLGKAQFIVGITDARGIKNVPELTIGEQKIPFQAGGTAPGITSGVRADLGVLPDSTAHSLDFNFNLELQGMESLWFVPTGKNTVVNIDSNWAHPSFYGRYLPDLKGASDTAGFPARWRVSDFSTNINKAYNDCMSTSDKCSAFQQNGFGVSLIQPADLYQQLERSAKYAVLFIGLTLIAFFAFEVFKRLSIHPIQYLLVGGALAMFYLLLTSLSEHLEFAHAYGIAAGACAGLIAFYVSFVLRSLLRGAIFGLMLGGLYGALFILLRSEDHALVLGSVLLFSVLAAIMISTRRVDWYALSLNKSS